MKSQEYKFADLARESGLSARQVRSYMSMGLIDAPGRKGRGTSYGWKDLVRLKAIAQLRDRGVSLPEIALIFKTKSDDELDALASGALSHNRLKASEVDAAQAYIQRMRRPHAVSRETTFDFGERRRTPDPFEEPPELFGASDTEHEERIQSRKFQAAFPRERMSSAMQYFRPPVSEALIADPSCEIAPLTPHLQEIMRRLTEQTEMLQQMGSRLQYSEDSTHQLRREFGAQRDKSTHIEEQLSEILALLTKLFSRREPIAVAEGWQRIEISPDIDLIVRDDIARRKEFQDRIQMLQKMQWP